MKSFPSCNLRFNETEGETETQMVYVFFKSFKFFGKIKDQDNIIS